MGVRTHQFSTGKFDIHIQDIDGLCCDSDNPPKDKEKSITISPKLKGRYRLEVLIHECLHAEYPSIDKCSEEEWVDTTAANISKLLWRLNYRG
jgi:hypothetical protein|tara:strand:+ start:183 stop:461 length:279 start_codon:yes stop_codon:yes gene_type:complete